ncbi:MAG: hypothetical protein ACP6IS_12555 [Candidatus Asgardarchaeia archaeon]
MATEKRWTAYDSIQTYFSTDLDSLADDARALGALIDFTTAGTDRKIYMDIELYLAQIDLTSQHNPAVYIWVLRKFPESSTEDGWISASPAKSPDVIIHLRTANYSNRVISRMVLTTPYQGKILLQNKSGVTLASSGNTLKYCIYSLRDVTV